MISPQRQLTASPVVCRIIVFGFLATFVSSFGQTFFIGLFGPQLEAAAGVGAVRLGVLYGLATLASGILLFWLGAALDRMVLPKATLIAVLIFTAGAAAVALAADPVLLLTAFFLLRLGGQGLMSHLGIVSAARGGGTRKGAMIGWVSMGVILGEAVLPGLVLAVAALFDWRWLWVGVAVLLPLAVLPALRLLGEGLPWRTVPGEARATPPRIGRRRLLLRQPTFWGASVVLLAPPFMVTGFLFEQASLGHRMHWSAHLIGVAFVVFAVARALGTWSFGRAADRFGSLRMTRLHLFPMAVAFAALALPPGEAPLWIAFAGTGFTAGANSVLGGAVWVDLFGSDSLGLVRGVFAACAVFATAAAPPVSAFLLSGPYGPAVLGLLFASYAVAVSLFVGPVLSRGARDAFAAAP